MNGLPHTLRAVPSIIDLDLVVAQVQIVDEDAGIASGWRGARALLSAAGRRVKKRTRNVGRSWTFLL